MYKKKKAAFSKRQFIAAILFFFFFQGKGNSGDFFLASTQCICLSMFVHMYLSIHLTFSVRQFLLNMQNQLKLLAVFASNQ